MSAMSLRRLGSVAPLCLVTLASCLDAPEEPEGVAAQPVVGSQLITVFDGARANLAAAGVALPTQEDVIDVATCDLSDPTEPSWSDVLGGFGYRYYDDLWGKLRTVNAPRTGNLKSDGATIKLRFNYVNLTASVTGSVTTSRVVYGKDAAGSSIEDCSLHTTADGTSDEALNCWDPVITPVAIGANRTSVTVTLARGNKATWSLPCGALRMTGTARIERPVTVGYVQVAAFPVGVVYEPSWPTTPGAFAKGFQEARATIGSSFTASVGTDSSAQDFKVATSTTATAKPVVAALGGLIGKAPFPGSSVVGGIVSAFANGLGTESVSEFDGTSTQDGASVQSTYSATERMSTNLMPDVAPVGPTGLGKRDILCWLRNAELGYLWVDGYTRLMPLGFDEKRCQYAYEVKAQLDRLRQRASCYLYPIFKRPSYCTVQPGEIPGSIADLEALLAIDPFTGDPSFRPETQPARFTDCQPMTMASYTFRWDQSNQAATTTGSASWHSRTVQATPGWLSLWGVGPTDPINTTIKTTHSRLRQTTAGTSLGTGFQIEGNGTSVSFVRCLDAAYTGTVAVSQ